MMNISDGHNGAQGRALPEKHSACAYAYGLSEDGFGKLTRARECLRHAAPSLLLNIRLMVGTLEAGCASGVAALMEYLRADLTDITHSCALIEGGAK